MKISKRLHWIHASSNTAKLCLYGRRGCVDISGQTSLFQYQGLEECNEQSTHGRSRWTHWQLASADLYAVGVHHICFHLSSIYKVKERKIWREYLQTAPEGASGWASVPYFKDICHFSCYLALVSLKAIRYSWQDSTTGWKYIVLPLS